MSAGHAAPALEVTADVEVDVTDPQVPVITVRLANAHHGARWPGDLVTLAADLARALIAEGLATRADGPQSPYLR